MAGSTRSASALRKRNLSLQGMRVAIQGFGNVGLHLARLLAEEGATWSRCRTRGRPPQRGRPRRPRGHRPQAGDGQPRRLSAAASRSRTRSVITLDCDVLAPCALEQVIHEDNAHQEGGDRPRGRERADHPRRGRDPRGPRRPRPPGRARERGRRRRLLLRVGPGPPGVLLEGVRGEREAERHRGARVRGDLGDARAQEMSMRIAAYGLAVERVAEATTTRGLYP